MFISGTCCGLPIRRSILPNHLPIPLHAPVLIHFRSLTLVGFPLPPPSMGTHCRIHLCTRGPSASLAPALPRVDISRRRGQAGAAGTWGYHSLSALMSLAPRRCVLGHAAHEQNQKASVSAYLLGPCARSRGPSRLSLVRFFVDVSEPTVRVHGACPEVARARSLCNLFVAGSFRQSHWCFKATASLGTFPWHLGHL